MGDLQYRVAVSDEDRAKVFSLRYAIYIDEMHRTQRFADHENKRIVEPYDDSALLYALFDGDECIGTVRANWLTDTVMKDYIQLYRVNLEPEKLTHAIATTKFMLSRRQRRAISVVDFFKFVCLDLLRRGARYNFGDANDNVLNFFFRLGYKRWGDAKAVHPEYGEVTVLFMDLFDVASLREARSPIADVAEQFLQSLGDVPR